MAPHTRRSHQKAKNKGGSVACENEAPTAGDNLQSRKRTISSIQPNSTTSTTPATHGPCPTKKARIAGPGHGRPMQLELMSEPEKENDQGPLTVMDNGKRKGKGKASMRQKSRQASLSFPSHQNDSANHVPSLLPLDGENGDTDISGDSDCAIEDEAEWLDEGHVLELAKRTPSSKMSEAMAIERPSWNVPATTGGATSSRGPRPIVSWVSSSKNSQATASKNGPTGAGGTSSSSTPIDNQHLFSEAMGIDAVNGDGHVLTSGTSAAATPSAGAVIQSSEVTTTERPTSPGCGFVGTLSQGSGDTEIVLSQELREGLARKRGPSWSADTHLVYSPGSNKIMLTIQPLLIRATIQDAFEDLRAALLFENAFPDPNLAVLFLKKTLVGAARSHLPNTVNIYNRLLLDDEYMGTLSRLPRARIPLFRLEVKERCASIMLIAFVAISDTPTVVGIVERQLSRYRYTFPTSTPGDPLDAPSVRTRPYRNARIITVIRDLYFNGGSMSFARRYESRFPTWRDNKGVIRREVPVPMVALAATALYAAIREWRTGTHHSIEFSANGYLDVYQGHVDTLTNIWENRNNAYHLMMSDIYYLASSSVGGNAVATIADLNLEEIED